MKALESKRGVLMIKSRTIFALMVCVIVCVTVGNIGCKKSSEAKVDPVGMLTGNSGCKGTQDTGTGQLEGVFASQARDCFQYQYDGSGTLTLTHVNAGFNCCPGEISATVSFIGHQIVISEFESAAECHCLCLYDLNYVLEGLEPGVYTIRFVEPYMDDGDEVLEFSVDLSSAVSGERCINRTTYPWVQ